jgi:predicted RNase H-like nuclease (RuvC/YqgF family)
MSKTLNQGTGRACACQGKTLGEVFATQDADKIRAEVSRRYEQEAVALTVRLEQAEDEVERLHVQNARLQKLVDENPLFDEHKRVMDENARLLGSLHEEQNQRREIDKALFSDCRAGMRSLSETVKEIEGLKKDHELLGGFVAPWTSLHDKHVEAHEKIMHEIGIDNTRKAIEQAWAEKRDASGLPEIEDLPIGYAFKVAAYVLDRAAELEE